MPRTLQTAAPGSRVGSASLDWRVPRLLGDPAGVASGRTREVVARVHSRCGSAWIDEVIEHEEQDDDRAQDEQQGPPPRNRDQYHDPEPGKDVAHHNCDDEQQHQGRKILPESVTQGVRTGEHRPVLLERDLAPDELHLQRYAGISLRHTLTDGK